jgi:aspartyl-tRNA(Asn)/glutamyl-tRNA(Gln) amidotransferase subunit A
MNDAVSVAKNILLGKVSAVEVTQAALSKIPTKDHEINCFTDIAVDTALQDAAHIDQNIAEGKSPRVLAGVPFAVKNSFNKYNRT